MNEELGNRTADDWQKARDDIKASNVMIEGEIVPPWHHPSRQGVTEHRMLSFRVPKAVGARIDLIAKHVGCSKSEFIRHALHLLLEKEEKKLKTHLIG